MKVFRKMLIAVLGMILFGTILSHATTNYDSKELEIDMTNVTAQTYGNYAYSTVYNFSDVGKGAIYGKFEIYVGYSWSTADTVTVDEEHSEETDWGIGPDLSLVYNFRCNISGVYNAANGPGREYKDREGFVSIAAHVPD